MSYIRKPRIIHSGLKRNELGLTLRDYEGGMSTLCAGCGHDSITAAIVQAFFELSIPPHRVAKMSGIGCSSKTPAYFLSASHGFNSVHGRMPSVATGANAANRDLVYLGVSGDGDSLSIGLGQFAHALRRKLNMLYLIENNGVYGLTKGQFSASADVGSRAKKGEVNEQPPIDPVVLAISQGCNFVARGFSGDKRQLVPLIKAGLLNPGFGMIDIISPCVTFNDHEGSTKSYAYTRKHQHEAVHADYIPRRQEIEVDYEDGEIATVELHDGSHLLLKKAEAVYDLRDRAAAIDYVISHHRKGEVVTGMLYMCRDECEMHDVSNTSRRPLMSLPFETLCPGADALADLQRGMR